MVARGFFHRLIRFLLLGPEDPDPDKPPTTVETLLPWPVRLLAVFAAWLLGWNWAGTPLGEQLGGGLQYAGLIAISLAVSYWWVIFFLNVSLALAWLLFPLHPDDDTPWPWVVHHTLSFVNRQVGHIEVLSVWVVLALVGPGTLPWQLAALTAVFLLSEPITNTLATWFEQRRSKRSQQRPSPDVYWSRRPLFYAATLLGIVAIVLLAPRQWFKLVPGVVALAVADTIRYLRHVRWTRAMARGGEAGRMTTFHAAQRKWGRRTDIVLGPGLVLAVLLVIVCANALARRSYDQALAKNLPTRGGPVDYCTVTVPPAPSPDVAMFLVSDSQFHELRGRRFVGQMEFADAIVPVALRPVELDVLSAVPLSRFASVYKKLADERSDGSRLWWAHLGDMADLACQNELDRSNRLLRDRFGPASFAGMAPGNHDKAFTGNFFWSPYWDSACPSGRLEKRDLDRKLQHEWKASVEGAGGTMLPVSGWDFMATVTQRGSALVTATPLGSVRHQGNRRGVIGVFLDSSDGYDFDLGVAGLFGTFSRRQAETANRAIDEVRKRAGTEYDDPFYLVFMHHPLGEFAPRTDARIKRWIANLDKGKGGESEESRARVLAVVSAHTHEAQKHSHCVGGREIPEVVVGSTTDPPQEAALLTVGPAADHTVSVRLQTLPVVARPEKACSSRAPTLTAETCQRVMSELRAHRDCAPLFRMAEANSLGRDCSDIEKPLEIAGRLQLASRWVGPGNEEEIRADQRRRVRDLWSCVCRDKRCSASPAVLDLHDDSYFELLTGELAHSPARETELACLAWAAAAVQRYKSAGMTMADALRCGFDDESLPAAHDYIARLEVTPCYGD